MLLVVLRVGLLQEGQRLVVPGAPGDVAEALLLQAAPSRQEAAWAAGWDLQHIVGTQAA